MRVLLTLLLFLCFSESFAQDLRRYEFEEEELLAFASFEALTLAEDLRDFKSYPALNFRRMGLPFDQLFHSPNLRQMLAVKFGLTPIGMREGEIIQVPIENLLVTHIKVKGIWALIVAQGFEEQELRELIKPNKVSSRFLDFLLPRAHAADCTEVHRVAAPLVELSQQITAQNLSSQIAQCLATGAQALTENLKQSLDFYRRIATEPLKVWQEFKQGMQAFAGLLMNLRQEATQLLTSLSHLSPSLKAEVICGLSGTLIASAGQALLLGPASLARALPGLTLKLRGMVEGLSDLTRLTRRLPPSHSQGLTRELLHCAL
jgi:hypothetical protein